MGGGEGAGGGGGGGLVSLRLDELNPRGGRAEAAEEGGGGGPSIEGDEDCKTDRKILL